MLSTQLAVMTTRILIRQPCLVKRFCVPCNKCIERARFGREILTELTSQTDSSFGIGILELHCSQANNIHALLNGLVLLRVTDHRNCFIQRWKPMQTVFDKVKEILLNESMVSFSLLFRCLIVNA